MAPYYLSLSHLDPKTRSMYTYGLEPYVFVDPAMVQSLVPIYIGTYDTNINIWATNYLDNHASVCSTHKHVC